jgi:hypothetical protein
MQGAFWSIRRIRGKMAGEALPQTDKFISRKGAKGAELSESVSEN